MMKKTWIVLVGFLMFGAGGLVGCGTVEDRAAPEEERASLATPTFPQCCTSINTSTPESTCDSIAHSRDRCNLYNGGGHCAWGCGCCLARPGSGYTDTYCSQFDALGRDRCNAVWQSTACTWACG